MDVSWTSERAVAGFRPRLNDAIVEFYEMTLRDETRNFHFYIRDVGLLINGVEASLICYFIPMVAFIKNEITKQNPSNARVTISSRQSGFQAHVRIFKIS
ncbi:hypothetical protein AVEN_49781-1 [Araneus ventricosus]|uniref:Uncharacterized protein n=1 Tax=Araneus ventricosus TaxID=182803 RepID=A0A4Y2TPP8_ARAVE|nr:hypothetical protein AVEN_264254-1 [Araneus ventricosus]GBO02073.1 hypothetical protein AVEN_49781-1 [Araneus ventricosus]